jgi:metal-responsive CopG/Arc/MetJ family transcriptional regulator
MGMLIPFRLRDGRDDDIRRAFECRPASEDRSDLIRAALRNYLFTKHSSTVLENMEAGSIELVALERTEEEVNMNIDKLFQSF